MEETKNYIKSYDYEWDFTPEQYEIMEKKWDYIENILPVDCKSVIDMGCGNGFFTNKFAEKYETTGVDINTKNFKKLNCKTIDAFAHELKLPRDSIDLVFSSEMLEHLPDKETLLKTINTFKRISKKYILITVPNNQNLSNSNVKCGNCGKVFNSSFHNFSFNQKILQELFSEFKALHFDTIGPESRPYTNSKLIYIRNHYANNWAVPNKYIKCPQCGSTGSFIHNRNLLSKACHLTNFIIARKTNAWILMLFEKKKK